MLGNVVTLIVVWAFCIISVLVSCFSTNWFCVLYSQMIIYYCSCILFSQKRYIEVYIHIYIHILAIYFDFYVTLLNEFLSLMMHFLALGNVNAIFGVPVSSWHHCFLKCYVCISSVEILVAVNKFISNYQFVCSYVLCFFFTEIMFICK